MIIYRDYKLLSKDDIKNFSKFEGTLVIYHSSDLPATFLKLMPKDFKMEKFDLPKLLFVFLENIYPGNSSYCLKLLHEVVKTEAVELVMFFIARHLRDLYWVKVDPISTGFPSWKTGKLKSQANKFTIDNIKLIIEKLSEIDILVKTSKADLLTELDLILIKELK